MAYRLATLPRITPSHTPLIQADYMTTDPLLRRPRRRLRLPKERPSLRRQIPRMGHTIRCHDPIHDLDRARS